MIQISTETPDIIIVGTDNGTPSEVSEMYMGTPQGGLQCLWQAMKGIFADGMWRDDQLWHDEDYWIE